MLRLPEPGPTTIRFCGKVALITGASDHGIGGAVAERLAEEGAAVAMISRSEPARLLRRLRRRRNEYVWMDGDVTNQVDVDRAVEMCREKFGRLDIVVNNAGVERTGPLEEMQDDDWEQLLDVNLTGVMRVTRTSIPHLTSPGGVIVSITSALGMAGCASFPAYSATKAGVMGMMQSLAMELAPRGIRAVCVAPGLVHSPMTYKYAQQLTNEVWARIEACHPLGMGSPHDVAAAVAFLASDDARWITGITLSMGWVPTMPLPVEQFHSNGRVRQ